MRTRLWTTCVSTLTRAGSLSRALQRLLIAGLSLAVMAPLAWGAAAPSQLLFHDLAAARPSTLPARAVAGSAREGRFNAESLAAGRVRMQLADGREWVAERRQEIRGTRGERTWIGEFHGAPGSLLSVTSYRGLVSGFIHHGSETWEIEATGPGRSNLYRVDETRLPPEGPLVSVRGDSAQGPLSGTLQGAEASADAPVVQDLLVVYTPAAANANGGVAGIETKILNAVAAANSGYSNSQVGIQLNLVGMAQTDYVETGDMGVSLSRVRVTNDGYMDEVHTLRNQVGADLVALVTNETNYCGIAYVMASPGSGFAASAFSVTQPGCFSNHTLAHEIGHNQGNAHDRVTGGTGAYPYSYGYRTCDHETLANGQSFRTIMGYACGSTPRVNHFSNPNIFYNNSAPMGVHYETDPEHSADNARSMNSTAPITAAFRSGPAGAPPAAPGALAASAASFDRVALAWVDNSGDETGFVLQRATGGGSYADRATLGANVTQFSDTGLTGGSTYSYRVRAFNSGGSSAYSNAITVTTPPAPPAPAAPSPASVAISGTVVTVTWANVADESGYEIRRETYSARKGTWSASTVTRAADSTLLTESLAAGTYRYSVRAVGPGGMSGYVAAGCGTCGSDGAFAVSATSGGGKKAR